MTQRESHPQIPERSHPQITQIFVVGFGEGVGLAILSVRAWVLPNSGTQRLGINKRERGAAGFH
jgi:hypothetical protein